MIENPLLLWGFGLLAVAVLLMVLEVFVPSGGLIGTVAAVVSLASVITFWRVSWQWGATSLAVVMILAPLAVSFALRVMPHTPVGKRLILSSEPEDAMEEARKAQERHAAERALIGATGLALTDLHPVGSVEIDGTRLEVLAEGGMVGKGRRVRVTSVDGVQIKVREIV